MVSAVTPGEVVPPLLPVNLGMHGGLTKVMFSCTCPPGAHLLLSPVVGRPRVSTCWPAAFTAPLVAPAARWVAAASPVALPGAVRVATPEAPDAVACPPATAEPVAPEVVS